MNIQNISKADRMVTVTLSADNLVMLCNAMHGQFEEKQNNEKFLQLYSDLMVARDLCQYGHIDDFCLHNVVKCRNGIGNGLNGVLSDNDIDTLNAYLEHNDIPSAFGNSDFRRVYKKIVGEHGKRMAGEKLKEWMKEQ